MLDEIDFDDSIFFDVANLDETGRSDSIIEDSFSSCVAGLASSTPVKSGPAPAPRSSRPIMPKKNRLPCPKCSNTYANERTLAVHVKMHAMKGTTSRIPKEEEICSVAQSSFECVVKEIMKEEESSGVFPDLLSYCQKSLDDSNTDKRLLFVKFLSESFIQCCGSQNALMPSALRCTLYIKANKMLCTQSFRDHCTELLSDEQVVDIKISNLFFGLVIFKLFEKLLAHVLKKMRGGRDYEDMLKRSSDNVNSKDFQEVVHYISGFIIHSFLRKGKKLSSSNTWNAYVDVLNRKFLASSLSVTDCSQVNTFTQSVSRGGLKHCSSEAFDFFYYFV